MAETPEEILSRLEKLFANRRRIALYGKGIFPTKYQGQNSDVFVTGKDFQPIDSDGKPITYQGKNILNTFAVTKFKGSDEAILLRIANSEKFAAFCDDDSTGEDEGRTKRDIERTGRRKDKKDKFDGDIKYVFLLRFVATPVAGTDTYKVLIGGHQPRPVFVAEFTGASISACPIELLKIDNLGGKKAIVNILLKISGGWRVYKYSVDGGSSDEAGEAIDTTAMINLEWQLNLLEKPSYCLGYGYWVYASKSSSISAGLMQARSIIDGQIVTSDALPVFVDNSVPRDTKYTRYGYVFVYPNTLKRQESSFRDYVVSTDSFGQITSRKVLETHQGYRPIRMDGSGVKAIGSSSELYCVDDFYVGGPAELPGQYLTGGQDSSAYQICNYLWMESKSPYWKVSGSRSFSSLSIPPELTKAVDYRNLIQIKSKNQESVIDFHTATSEYPLSSASYGELATYYSQVRGSDPPLQYAGAEIPVDISDKKDWWFAHSLKDVATVVQQPEKITIPVSWFDSGFRSKGEPIDVEVAGLPANLTSSTGGVLFSISPTPNPIFFHSSFFHSK